ncbi:MAG TPA: hypothetical protein PK397_07065 [Ignavibacteriaceae bacterium]|nr:hypothetical protein [Ignavibacteriaceae bacterium]
MKNLVFLIGLITLFYGCKEAGEGTGFVETSKLYPARLNNSWEYEVSNKIEFYNNYGQIDSTEVLNWPNQIISVIKTGDSVGTYSNLVLFENHIVGTPDVKHYIWFLNNDDGFYSVAYAGSAGESSGVSINPKLNPGKKYLTIEEFRKIASLENGILTSLQMLVEDSIGYWNPPRKALAYPLKTGQRWIELIHPWYHPWYRERFINKTQTLSTSAGTFNCYKVEVDWPMIPNIIFNDYINTEYGLIYREIIDDSVEYSTLDNPESFFCKMTSKAILVNKNF